MVLIIPDSATMKQLIIALLAAAMLPACRHFTEQDSLHFLKGDFQSANYVHFKQMFNNRNTIMAYGRMGKEPSHMCRDSMLYWDKSTLALTDRRKLFDIIVDTTSRFALELGNLTLVDFKDTANLSVDSSHKKSNWEYARFSSLPVYIVNTDTTDHILNLQDAAVFMIYEAQDSSGNWRPIEFWKFATFCGNSYYELVFKPRYFVVTKVLEHSGNYKTKLRLKLQNFDRVMYSAPFTGHINYAQFDQSRLAAYAQKHAELFYGDRSDSVDYFAKQYLKKLLLEN